jgi:hypothetical protein
MVICWIFMVQVYGPMGYCSLMARTTPSNRDWKDEYTLLCEKCGYVVEGLDQAGVCPECGKPIVESLPERRVGTPWQQEPGFKSLVRTWWMTLRHPKRTLDIQSSTHPRGLLLLTTSTASALASVGWILPVYLPIKNPDEFPAPSMLGTIPVVIIFALIPLFLFIILTIIETQGLRFFGNRKGYRVTHEMSKAITAHGSVGWLLCALGLTISALFGYAFVFIMTPQLPAPTGNEILDSYNRLFTGPPSWVYTVNLLLYTLILPGFLFFEFFAYLGLRRCKYANRVRPQGDLTEPKHTDPRTT